MNKNRLEAFSDGVVAILITIMVLELHAPEEATWEALRPLAPTFLAYVLSFFFIGICWNNHHHLLQAARRINGAALWANLVWLFSLSLIPFTTAWMEETLFASLPVALYGVVMMMAAFAYVILAMVLVREEGPESLVAQAARPGPKELITLGCHVTAILLAFVNPYISCALYVVVGALWLVPDRRIESRIHDGT